ncbi:MAG: succinate dehydrogenase cytochrome b subunit [Brumimicrobium sp.]|nr:succinate dehydrogenase cytochrome b subunit [Brumimicrobium sp.]
MSKPSFFKSSIGRKVAMSLSAIFLMIFLLQHLAINITAAWSPELFNELSHFMGYNPLVQYIAQPILVFAVVFHFVTGIILERKNHAARPIKYAKYNGAANSSWFSRHMGPTGLVILVFLGLHLYDFFFPEINSKYIAMDPADPNRYYPHLVAKFQDPIRVAIYALGFVSLSLHLMHGFGSAFQSLGQNNKYIDALKKFGKAYAILVPLGFIVLGLILHFKG